MPSETGGQFGVKAVRYGVDQRFSGFQPSAVVNTRRRLTCNQSDMRASRWEDCALTRLVYEVSDLSSSTS